MLRSAPWLEPANRAVLRDSRLTLHERDARVFLRNVEPAHDVVVANTLHPWSLGATGLYSLGVLHAAAVGARSGWHRGPVDSREGHRPHELPVDPADVLRGLRARPRLLDRGQRHPAGRAGADRAAPRRSGSKSDCEARGSIPRPSCSRATRATTSRAPDRRRARRTRGLWVERGAARRSAALLEADSALGASLEEPGMYGGLAKIARGSGSSPALLFWLEAQAARLAGDPRAGPTHARRSRRTRDSRSLGAARRSGSSARRPNGRTSWTRRSSSGGSARRPRSTVACAAQRSRSPP